MLPFCRSIGKYNAKKFEKLTNKQVAGFIETMEISE